MMGMEVWIRWDERTERERDERWSSFCLEKSWDAIGFPPYLSLGWLLSSDAQCNAVTTFVHICNDQCNTFGILFRIYSVLLGLRMVIACLDESLSSSGLCPALAVVTHQFT
jgi:hypothetical protein